MAHISNKLRLFGLSATIFATFILLTHQTFLGDDWSWISIALNHPSFAWTEPSVFARMPVFSIYMVAALKSGLLVAFPRLFLIFFFAVHAWVFASLFEVLTGLKTETLRGAQAKSFLTVGLLFTFWPNNYEIHLWHIESLHALGALCVIYAYRIKQPILQLLLLIAAFLTYETFVLFFAGLVLLRLVTQAGEVPASQLRGEAKRYGLLLLSAGILSLGVKLALGKLLHQLPSITAETQPLRILSNMKTTLNNLWLIHVYKANWVYSILQMLAFAWIAKRAHRVGGLSKRKIAALIVLPTIVALPLALNTYTAQRAYFGPQLLMAAAFAYLSFSWLGTIQATGLRRLGPLTLLFLLYTAQWTQLFWVKNHNYNTLQRDEAFAVKLFEQCVSPCSLILPTPGKGLKTDYVLSDVRLYYKYIARSQFPDKSISFEISDAP